MRHNYHHHDGMTLIETMIYLALFSIIMLCGIVAMWNIIDATQRNRDAFMIQEEGTFITDKIAWALRGATVVHATGDTLTITRPDLVDVSQSPLTIISRDGELLLARGTNDPVSLNAHGFTVTDVTFAVTDATGDTPARVAITFYIHDVQFSLNTILSP